MAAPIKWGQGLRGYIKDGSSCVEDVITVEATTATGFEGAAASEVASKFKLESSEVVRAQGRVLFDIPTEKVAEVRHCILCLYLIRLTYLEETLT